MRVNENVSPESGISNGPWLFAHRGTSTLAPENSEAAFDLAMSARADVLEIDVRITRDQNIIVTHDATVDRTTNGEGLVSQHSLSQLKVLDAGYQYRDENQLTPWRSKGLTLLTLSELFDAFPAVGINIDIKDPEPQAAQLVADAIRKLNDGRWINVGSFHPKSVAIFRDYAPELRTAASQWDVAKLYFGRQLPRFLRNSPRLQAGGQVLQIPTGWYGLPLNTVSFIAEVQRLNRQVMYWTINEPSDMQTLLLRGADGLVSDNVLVARSVIDLHKTAPVHLG